jgi:hypothetical protein
VPIVAAVSNAVGNVTVEFSSGDTLIGSVSSSPYQFTWTDVPPGDHSLTAKVTDGQGHTVTSLPVRITISQICGDVGIVRTAVDPETDRLQEALFVMGLSSQVFDHTQVSLTTLQGYRLVIWHDVATGGGLTANDVTLLQGAYLNGIPLYFIGEHLASSAANLPAAQRSQWIDLTHLQPTSGTGGDGVIHVQSSVDFSLILQGRFARIQDFPYPDPVDPAKAADSDSDVIGTSGGSDVLLSYPSLAAADTGQVRTFTQNLRVLPDISADSPPLAGLFQNVVCWLLRCPNCGDIDVAAEMDSPPNPVPAGAPITYVLRLVRSGECEALGTVLTDFLPPGFQFIGAQSELGTWSYDSATHEVIFRLGHLPTGDVHQMPIEVSVDVLPTQSGTFTNSAFVQIDGPEVTLDNNRAEAVTVVSGGTSILGPRLDLRVVADGGYELHASSQVGGTYALQYSTDLVQWLTLTNVAGPEWSMPLPAPGVGERPFRFYRVRSP